MKFLGIYREPEYSPGRHMANDAKILRLVAQALEREEGPIRLVTLDEARTLWKEADLIFTMCQGPDATAELATWKKKGALILNDPEASRNTYRDRLCSTLNEKELGFPHSEILSTEAAETTAPVLERFRSWFEGPRDQGDRKSTRLNSSHIPLSRMP